MLLLTFAAMLVHAEAPALLGYGKTTWGMDVTAVRKAVPTLTDCQGMYSALAYCEAVTMFERPGEAAYLFEDGVHLSRVKLKIDATNSFVFEKLCTALRAKYGPPSVDTGVCAWPNLGIHAKYSTYPDGSANAVVNYDGAAATQMQQAGQSL